MSNIIYFTENKTKGVQVSAELLDMLQTTEKTLEQAFVCMMGNNGIVCGCNNLGGGIYAEGLIIWNNELFVFKGGPLGAYIIVDSVTTQCTFCSGDVKRIWTVKTAKFAASIPDDGTGIAVTADLPEFYHPEYTFFTLDAQVVENTTDIANIEGDIVDIQGDITDIQTDITNLQTNISIVNIQNAIFEIGDTMYVKNITDFNGSGVGTAGTKRENWCLVHPGNFLWRTALGLPGGTTFNDVDGRTLVSAGTKYSALTMFGIDSATLSAANLPPHRHTGVAAITEDSSEAVSLFSDANNLAGITKMTREGREGAPYGSGSDQQEATVYYNSGDGTDNIDNQGEVGNGAGAATAHENRQPSLALYLMVKYQ